MHKLGPFVEERRIVFVRLDNEIGGLAEARRNSEIGGNTANQKTGIEPGILEYPGEHARGRGLAVRARDSQDPAILQDVFGQPLWP